MVSENAFRRGLDAWIEDFRTEAVKQFAAGCAVTDVMRIAMMVADSKRNREASERQRLTAPLEIVGGQLPRA